MKTFLSLFLFTVFSCSTIAQKQKKAPQEIKSYYFQNWSAGQELGGSGTDFYIEFKNPLSPDIQLNKIYFKNKVANFEKITETMFIAHFLRKAEMIIDENGNQTIVHKEEKPVKPKIKLAENDALIEFVKAKKNSTFILRNTEEKEFLAYPSPPPLNKD